MTNDMAQPSHTLRSIVAVVVGFLLITILSIATDIVLHYTKVFPPLGERVPDKLLLLATTYRCIIGTASCYLTARLAPNRPMFHAMVLGVIGFVLSIVGVVATWNGGPAYEPKWYPIALVVLALPGAWLGGKLRERQL